MAILDQLNHLRQSIGGIYPEIFLTLFFLALLVVELLLRKVTDENRRENVFFTIYTSGAFVTLALVISQWFGERGFLFNGMLFVGSKAIFFKGLIILGWLFSILHMRRLKYRFPPEIYTLIAATALGAMLLCMATHLLTIYLAVEIISLSSYLLVGLSPQAKSSEGGLKYLLFGTISSAVMLYGISFIYGITGTLDISSETMGALLAHNSPIVLYGATFLTLGGLLFKLSLVPFHIWTPDAYEAAPTPIVSFLSVIPKIAVLLALMRLVYVLPYEVRPLLGGIALISMTVGNVAALAQTNARRLLAYSTIAQAGYLIVGIVAFSETGFEAATFYLVSYAILNMAAFYLIDTIAPRSDANLGYFNGKGTIHLISGIALTVVMVGLAGLPPTIGFTGKWLVFSSLWETFQSKGETWMLVLLIGGLLNAAISLAYYLKIPYLLYFKTADQQEVPLVTIDRILAGLLALIIVVLFFQPQWVSDLISLL